MSYINGASRSFIKNVSRQQYMTRVSFTEPNATMQIAKGKTFKWACVFLQSDGNMKIGTTLGGNDLFDGDITSEEFFPTEIGYSNPAANQTIYFTGGVDGDYIDCYVF